MGMYTTFHAKFVVKEEYRGLIQVFNCENTWESLATLYESYDWLHKWAAVERCNFIPRGGGGFVPTGWANSFEQEEDTSPWNTYDVTTGEWEMVCSLKNYEGEIEDFCKIVISEIAESVAIAESMYETKILENELGSDNAPLNHIDDIKLRS